VVLLRCKALKASQRGISRVPGRLTSTFATPSSKPSPHKRCDRTLQHRRYASTYSLKLRKAAVLQRNHIQCTSLMTAVSASHQRKFRRKNVPSDRNASLISSLVAVRGTPRVAYRSGGEGAARVEAHRARAGMGPASGATAANGWPNAGRVGATGRPTTPAAASSAGRRPREAACRESSLDACWYST
jgi:hypothetical protein